MMESLKFFGAVALAMVLPMVAIFALAHFSTQEECSTYQRVSGERTLYSWSTGCLVKTRDGRWVKLDALTGNSSDVTVRSGE
ncbi:hypothetical protein [Burkholderia ubonensis]|uniref:hypothetical protein n=1 Tax=Burkholderia ubonensis TaxID=101571 RepID=UPI000752A5C3|nr:hypothetical protein [Burkholderia ubonensis]KVQ06862.1 hypothetical protein WK00_08950 [Burkholderia ubonensis]